MATAMEDGATFTQHEITRSCKPDVASVRNELKSIWPEILEVITMDKEYSEADVAMTWLRKLLVGNVPNGKINRGVGIVMLYRELKPVRTPEEDLGIYVIAWCLEIVSPKPVF